MEPTEWQLKSYLQEIIHQAEAAVIHARNYNAAIGKPAAERVPESFAAIQGILTAAAQVNQLLWVNHGPEKPREYGSLSDHQWEQLKLYSRSRARKLRKLLRASDDSPIKSRAVRNSFEHFDARLDKRLLFGNSILFDRIIGPDDFAGLIEGVHGDLEPLRRIDPATNKVSVLDQTVSFQELCAELERLAEAAARQLNRPVDFG